VGRLGRLNSNWLAAAGVLLFGIAGGVWTAFNAGGAPARVAAFCLVGFVFSALLGVFVVVVFVLLLGALRELWLRAHFARARRRGDLDAIEVARTGHGADGRDSDALGRFINAHLDSETGAARNRNGPTR
jgi:hypothetical protein